MISSFFIETDNRRLNDLKFKCQKNTNPHKPLNNFFFFLKKAPAQTASVQMMGKLSVI